MTSRSSTKRKRRQPDFFSPLSVQEEKQVVQVLQISLRQIPGDVVSDDEILDDDDEILEEQEEDGQESESEIEVKGSTEAKITSISSRRFRATVWTYQNSPPRSTHSIFLNCYFRRRY